MNVDLICVPIYVHITLSRVPERTHNTQSHVNITLYVDLDDQNTLFTKVCVGR